MKTRPFLLLLALLLAGQLLASRPAAAQVVVRVGRGYYGPPRAYYGPRYYCPPPVVYAAPRPVMVVPAHYYGPRAYYAPRPYYGHRHGGWGHGRR